MHKLYGEQALLALPHLFRSTAARLRGDTYIQCNFSVEPASPELFGARLATGAKLFSIPYIGAFSRGRQGLRLPATEEFSEFARSTKAHEAIKGTIYRFNTAAERMYEQNPVGLNKNQAADLLCVSPSYYIRKVIDEPNFSIIKEEADTRTGSQRIYLPPKGLQELLTWEFPESYPEELIKEHPPRPIIYGVES